MNWDPKRLPPADLHGNPDSVAELHDIRPIAAPAGTSPGNGGHDQNAEKERLILQHLPIVRVVAQRIYKLLPEHVSFEGLYSAGVRGLIGALDKFQTPDPVQFPGYVRLSIREAIIDDLRGLVWNAEELRRKGRPIENAIHALNIELDHSPSELEISHELSIELATYHRLLDELKGIEINTHHSTRSTASGEEDIVNLANGDEDHSQLSFWRADMQTRLSNAITELPDRERLVLTLSYHEGLTLKEIGLVLDEAESRLSQIHASAILHLRSRLSDFGYE
jgi:RNA polymerase sigma factor for flagellar operon FliA